MHKTRSKTFYPPRVKFGDRVRYTWDQTSTSEDLVYADGPKYIDHHSNWKPCTHVKQNFCEIPCGAGIARDTQFSEIVAYQCYLQPFITNVPDIDWSIVRSAALDLNDKFDLNAKDRLMSYSYVADLLPFAGAALRASSVLNRIGKWATRLGRNLKHRPFTVVLKEAIQADLINRFVVQTTIEDTKNILDIWNQMASTWDKLHRRNWEPTTLTGRATSIHDVGSGTEKLPYPPYPWNSGGNAQYVVQRGTTAKVVATMQLAYNTEQADPMKWVAAQLGITTPLESIWDKVPFSFVVDYFFRVGDAINYFGDKYTSQDGLRATVSHIFSCWAMARAVHVKRCIAYEPWIAGTRPSMCNGYLVSGETGSSIFIRKPIDCTTESGFWDKGGFWDPHLSSVRKRTLLELGLLIGGGKFKQ